MDLLEDMSSFAFVTEITQDKNITRLGFSWGVWQMRRGVYKLRKKNKNKKKNNKKNKNNNNNKQPHFYANDSVSLIGAAYIFVPVFFEYLHMRNFSVFSICSHCF